MNIQQYFLLIIISVFVLILICCFIYQKEVFGVHLNKGTQSTTGNFWSRGMVSFCSNFIPPIYQKLQESISRSKIPIESIKLESDIYQNHSIFMKKHWQ